MADFKETLRAAVKTLLTQALAAVAKLVRTKLLPRAIARACKHLQDASEALILKADSLIASVTSEEDESKRIKKLYMLALIKNTIRAVGKLLTASADHIDSKVDFDEIENSEAAKVIKEAKEKAKAKEDTEYDELIAEVNTPHCDDDGCTVV